jgi:hypothetical protein
MGQVVELKNVSPQALQTIETVIDVGLRDLVWKVAETAGRELRSLGATQS